MVKDSFLSNLIELPVKIILNGNTIGDLLCSPKNINELFTGWLISEGYINTPNDINDISFDIQTSAVNITAKCKVREDKQLLSFRVCESLHKEGVLVEELSKNDVDLDIVNTLKKYGSILQDEQIKGLHGALLYCDGKYVIKQDVSRHCAVDKVIGSGIQYNMDVTKSILFTTGRVSSEFLSKAQSLSIPMIASIKYPSETGKLVAKDWQITVASFILKEDIKIYPANKQALNIIFNK